MLEDKLRSEIVASQKFQSELSKWKLILLAGIAAAALGSIPGVPLTTRVAVLALAPFVALYVDSLSFYSGTRIMTTAQYFRTRGERKLVRDYLARRPDVAIFDDYEIWSQGHRKHSAVDSIAAACVSITTSAIVYVIGSVGSVRALIDERLVKPTAATTLVSWSGAVGVLANVLFLIYYRMKMRQLDRVVHEVRDEEASLRELLSRHMPVWVTICDDGAREVKLDPHGFSTSDNDLLLLGAAVKYADGLRKRVVVAHAAPTMIGKGGLEGEDALHGSASPSLPISR